MLPYPCTWGTGKGDPMKWNKVAIGGDIVAALEIAQWVVIAWFGLEAVRKGG